MSWLSLLMFLNEKLPESKLKAVKMHLRLFHVHLQFMLLEAFLFPGKVEEILGNAAGNVLRGCLSTLNQ